MAKIAGSVWVDGITFHYVDKNAIEWYFTGALTGASVGAARPGSVWVDGSYIHYIDTAPADRILPIAAIAVRAGAVPGSPWVESTANTNFSLHFINSGGVETASHEDIPLIPHSDIAHSDVAHADGSSGPSQNGAIGGGAPTDFGVLTVFPGNAGADTSCPGFQMAGWQGGQYGTLSPVQAEGDTRVHSYQPVWDSVPNDSSIDGYFILMTTGYYKTTSKTVGGSGSYDHAVVFNNPSDGTPMSTHSDVAHSDIAHADIAAVPHFDQPTSLGA